MSGLQVQVYVCTSYNVAISGRRKTASSHATTLHLNMRQVHDV